MDYFNISFYQIAFLIKVNRETSELINIIHQMCLTDIENKNIAQQNLRTC